MLKLTDSNYHGLIDIFVYLPLSNLKFYYFVPDKNTHDLYLFLHKVLPVYNSLKNEANEIYLLKKIIYLIFLNIEKNFSKNLFWGENEKLIAENIFSDFNFFLSYIAAPDLPLLIISFILNFISFSNKEISSSAHKCPVCEKEFIFSLTTDKIFILGKKIKFLKNSHFKKISEKFSFSKNKFKIEVIFKIPSLLEFFHFSENYLQKFNFLISQKLGEGEGSFSEEFLISELNNPFFPVFKNYENLILTFFVDKIIFEEKSDKKIFESKEEIFNFFENIPVPLYEKIISFYLENFEKKYLHKLNYSVECFYCGSKVGDFLFSPFSVILKNRDSTFSTEKLYESIGNTFVKFFSISEGHYSGLFDLFRVPPKTVEVVSKGLDEYYKKKKEELEKLKREQEKFRRQNKFK